MASETPKIAKDVTEVSFKTLALFNYLCLVSKCFYF